MQVLKFGGTSVGSAVTIKKVIGIVHDRQHRGTAFVVVSAMSGTTDSLLESGALAARGDEQYKDILQRIELRHLETVKELIPVQQQSATLSLVKTICNECQVRCRGAGSVLHKRRLAAPLLETQGVLVILSEAQELIVFL